MINKLNINTVKGVDINATCIIQDIEYILNNYNILKKNKDIELDIEVEKNRICIYILKSVEDYVYQGVIYDYSSLIHMLEIEYSNDNGLYDFYHCSYKENQISSLFRVDSDIDFKEMCKKAKSLVENE